MEKRLLPKHIIIYSKKKDSKKFSGVRSSKIGYSIKKQMVNYNITESFNGNTVNKKALHNSEEK